LAALIALTTAYGAPAGIVALKPGPMVAVFAGGAGSPAGAPGTGVAVVVVVVCPAAGPAAMSAPTSSVAASPSRRPW
jgi:hypothetical protein